MPQTSYSVGNKYSLSMTVVEEANFRGELFYSKTKLIDVIPTDNVEIVISAGVKDLFIVSRTFTTTTDRLDINMYDTPTYTGGANDLILPYNNIDPKIPTTIIKENVTVTNDGTLVDEFMILGDPNNVATRVAGEHRVTEGIRMIPAGFEVLVRFINAGTVDMTGLVKFLFFERKAGLPLT